MPERGLPPSSRSSACASTVLPAPVSPVITVSPSRGLSSARSIRSRFSIRSSSSTRPVYQRGPTERPRRYALVGQPPELVAEAVVERRARQLGEQRLALLEADPDGLSGPRGADPAAVGGHVHRLLDRP